ncbi:MAG: hypothetical protein AAFQ94_09370 [Bacteroidota bacterium]
MSSHHIVRDEQEPALIISDFLESQQEDIGQLLEWSPTVIAIESALHDLLTLGIKIDVVVVPEEKIPYWEEQLQYQYPIQYLTTGGDTLLVFAQIIGYLLKKNYKTFHVLSNQLTLFDFINLYERFKYRAELIYINESQKISIYPVGNYKKWLRQGQGVSVFPIEEPTYIRTSGFTQNHDNELLTAESYFEVEAEGLVTVETNLKPVIVAEIL